MPEKKKDFSDKPKRPPYQYGTALAGGLGILQWAG